MRRTIGGIVLGLMAVLGSVNNAGAQFFLEQVTSPQAFGRGGLYTYESNDDPLAPLSNPAFLGFLAEHHRFMGSFYAPRTVVTLPMSTWAADRMRLSARAVNVGFDQGTVQRYFKIKLPLSIGLGYQEAFGDWGKITQMDQHGNVIDEYTDVERTQGLAIGAALHGRVWQFSAGFAARHYSMDYHETDTDFWGNDLGAIVQFNIMEAADPHHALFPVSAKRLQPFCVTATGYSASHLGGRYTWTSEDHEPGSDPQYQMANVFFNIAGGLKLIHPVTNDFTLIAGSMGVEGRDVLREYYRSGESYIDNPIGDMHVFDDLLFGHSNDQITKRRGFELTVAEFFSIRSGIVESLWLPNGTTRGYGARLTGLLKLACYDPMLGQNQTVRYLAKHLDLEYNWSIHHHRKQYYEYGSPLSAAYNNATFESIVLLWKP